MSGLAEDRVARIVSGAVRQALVDAGASGLIVLEDETPEARLLLRWCKGHGVEASPAPPGAAQAEDRAVALELQRAAARIEAGRRGLLLAHPVNATALWFGAVPPDPMLPLGDVPATWILAFAGACTVPDFVRELADRVGGLEELDRIAHGWLERREAFAVATRGIAKDDAAAIRRRFESARFWRRRAGLVPKLGHRTVGHDLLT